MVVRQDKCRRTMADRDTVAAIDPISVAPPGQGTHRPDKSRHRAAQEFSLPLDGPHRIPDARYRV